MLLPVQVYYCAELPPIVLFNLILIPLAKGVFTNGL
jgi:hypothetical protein